MSGTAKSSVVMDEQGVLDALSKCRESSSPGKEKDGSRIHVRYRRMGPASREVARAGELDLPEDAYTGRLDRLWRSGGGDLILTMLVELERTHQYRSFNVTRGEVIRVVVMEE